MSFVLSMQPKHKPHCRSHSSCACDAWSQMLSPLIHLRDFLADKSRLALFIFLLPLLPCLALASASVLFSSSPHCRSSLPSPISSLFPPLSSVPTRGDPSNVCVIYSAPIDYRPPPMWRECFFFFSGGRRPSTFANVCAINYGADFLFEFEATGQWRLLVDNKSTGRGRESFHKHLQ